jgi:hypothetical protein
MADRSHFGFSTDKANDASAPCRLVSKTAGLWLNGL